MKYFKTGDKFEATDYPYGYNMRTSMFFWVEFKPGKGYRAVRQSVNPKNGRMNKPKAGTYTDFMFLAVVDGKASFKSKSFYEAKEYNSVIDWLSDKWQLMNDEERKYCFMKAINYLRVTAKAQCIYCGSKWEDIKPIIEAAIKPLLDGVKSLSLDDFKTSRLDAEALESKKIDGYNPFKTTYLE